MAADSGQKFLGRNRKPRVHITYEDPYDANRQVELPFVMGVLADLSGNASDVARPEVAESAFLDIDMDNFERRMAAIRPAAAFRVTNRLTEDTKEELPVKLTFEKMDDFSPASVARQVPALARLLEARTQLANLLRYMDGKVSAEDALKKLLADKDLMLALSGRPQAPSAGQAGEQDQ